MDIGFIFLYSVFTILQIFFLFSVGMVSFVRKIYTNDSLKKLSMLLMNLFFPVQGMLEIARMASADNISVFWIMVVSVSSAMFIGFIIAIPSLGTLPLVLGRAFCFPGGPLEGDSQCGNMLGYMNINSLIFNLILFISGFNLITSDKNIGEEIEQKLAYCWPLVCERLYNGKNFTVLRLFNKYMTKNKDNKAGQIEFEKFDLDLRLINIPQKAYFTLVNAKGELREQNNYHEIMDKKIEEDKEIENINKENKYYEDNEISENNRRATEEQKKRSHNRRESVESQGQSMKNKLNESHRSYNKSGFEKSYDSRFQKISIGENDVQLSIHELSQNQKIKEENEEQVHHEEEQDNIAYKKVYVENQGKYISEQNLLILKKPIERKPSIRVSKLNFDNLFEGVKDYFNIPSFKDFHKYVANFLKANQKNLMKNLSNYQKLHKHTRLQKKRDPVKYLSRELKYENDIVIADDNKHLKRDESYDRQKKSITHDYKKFLDKKLTIIRKNTINLDKSPIMIYFGKIFEKIEEFRYKEGEVGFDIHEDNVYHIEKINILIHLHGKEFEDDPELKGKQKDQIYNIHKKEEEKLLEVYFDHDHPPSFPIARGLNINEELAEKIENIWKEYKTTLKNSFPDFEFSAKRDPTDLSLILNKVYSPILLGSILGLLIGISGMREVLFSTNHYISNLVEGILVISKAAVPFLYISVGVQFLTMPKMDLNMVLTKKHIILSLIQRYVILPGLGLLWVYLWKTYYGGLIETSRVFRISLFIPFCVPSSANISMLVNLIGYFREESSVLLFIQNLSMLVGLTILYMIYFIVIGL